MAGKHWSEEELIQRLYGVGPEGRHLEECEECGERWRRLLAVRSRVLESPQAPEEFLARQRRAIYQRIEQPDRRAWRPALVHAAGLALLLVFALLVLRPGPEPQPTMASASSDAQFFSEVYSEVQSIEPDAVAPIRGLFEVQQ